MGDNEEGLCFLVGAGAGPEVLISLTTLDDDVKMVESKLIHHEMAPGIFAMTRKYHIHVPLSA
jgi:hypothetical protein